MNQRKVGAVLSYVSLVVGYIVSLAYTPVMLRILGRSEYGLYNLASSVVAYLGLLNFGFTSAYLRYYIRAKVQQDHQAVSRLNGMFLIIFSVIGLVAAAAGLAASFNVDLLLGSRLSPVEKDRAGILMLILTCNMAISFPASVFTFNITANERFFFQKLIGLVKLVTNPFLNILVLVLGYGSIGLALVMALTNLAFDIIYAFYAIKTLNMRFSFSNFNWQAMREMSAFSAYIFLNMITDQVNWNVDKLVLGHYHGTVSVAIYGLAAQLNQYFISLSYSISSVFIPRVHQIIARPHEGRELTLVFTKIGRLQFMLLSMVAIGIVFFGKPFIEQWAGIGYLDSYPILLLLALPAIVSSIQNIGIEIQRAKNMHKFRSVAYFFIAVLNIALTIWLAKPLGGVGAAMGTAIALVIGNWFAMNWYYHKKIGLDIPYFWRQILGLFPALLPPAGYAILMFYIGNLRKGTNLLLFGLLYVLVFILSMWFFGMNEYEKDLFRKPAGRLLLRRKTAKGAEND